MKELGRRKTGDIRGSPKFAGAQKLFKGEQNGFDPNFGVKK